MYLNNSQGVAGSNLLISLTLKFMVTVAKLVDAPGCGPGKPKRFVGVQVPSVTPFNKSTFLVHNLLL